MSFSFQFIPDKWGHWFKRWDRTTTTSKPNGRLLQSCHPWVGNLAAKLREGSKYLALAKIRVFIGTAREGVIPWGDAAWQVEKASLDSTRECCEMHRRTAERWELFIFIFIFLIKKNRSVIAWQCCINFCCHICVCVRVCVCMCVFF